MKQPSSQSASLGASQASPSLAERCGERWNEFWYEPQDPMTVAVLRLLVGVLAVYYILGFSLDLTYWFGQNGVLPRDTVAQLTGAEQGWAFRASWFQFTSHPVGLWILHGIGILVAVLFTLGFASRVTNLLTLAAVLSYVHRAPMLTGVFEPVLCFMLLYLCLAPTGRCLSLDRRLGWGRKKATDESALPGSCEPSISAGVATRLIQVHLAAMYLLMATNQLAGETWWNGEAIWWLAARPESRLVDLTGLLSSSIYLINGLTHLVVLLEIGFAIFVWHPFARPYVLSASLLLWLLLALPTGLLSFAAIMVAGNVAFLSPRTLHRLVERG